LRPTPTPLPPHSHTVTYIPITSVPPRVCCNICNQRKAGVSIQFRPSCRPKIFLAVLSGIHACEKVCGQGYEVVYYMIYLITLGRIALSVYRLTTGWTVRGSNPSGARFSARPDRPWGPTSLLYNGYRVFPGGKVWPGRAADHSPPSIAAVMEE
jgi:hypothetical protein